MRVNRTALFIGALLLAAPLAAEQQPSMELLEFLGAYETSKGRWIDPTQLPAPAPVPAPTAEAPESAKEKNHEPDAE